MVKQIFAPGFTPIECVKTCKTPGCFDTTRDYTGYCKHCLELGRGKNEV